MHVAHAYAARVRVRVDVSLDALFAFLFPPFCFNLVLHCFERVYELELIRCLHA